VRICAQIQARCGYRDGQKNPCIYQDIASLRGAHAVNHAAVIMNITAASPDGE
jgi:hypothetical protein